MASACNVAVFQQMQAEFQSHLLIRSRKNPVFKVRASNGSCCGGSGGGGSSCSSSDKKELTLPELDYKPGVSDTSTSSACSSRSSESKSKPSGLDNVGKEFEALVAQQTMLELEKDYETTQMRGTISRDVMQSVMSIKRGDPSAYNSCVDLDRLVADGKDCNFIFSEGQDEDIVLV